MATQKLYLRSTQSTVVTGTATCNSLSTTQGTSVFTGTSIKRAKNTGTWQFIPGTANNTTTFTTGTTPNTKGWLFDGAVAGTYAAGTWTATIETVDTSASGTANVKVSVWVVTATTTAVTSVTQLCNAVASSSYTPSTTKGTHTVTFSPGTVTLTSGQYLYMEVYFNNTVASSSTTATETIEIDDTGTGASNLLTTSFTVASTAWTKSASSTISFDAVSNYAQMVLADNPVAYWRCNDSGSTLTDSGPNGLNGTIGANCTIGSGALISGDNTAGSITTPGGTTFDAAHTAQVPRNAALEVSSVTLEAWIKFPTASVNNDILGYILSSATEYYLFWRADVSVTITLNASGGAFSPITTGSALTSGPIYHVVGTYDQTTGQAQMWLNGTLMPTSSSTSSGPITGYSTSAVFVIGGAGASDLVSVTAAEVAVYNYVLPSDRIRAHYQMGTAPTNGTIKAIGKALTGALSFLGSLASSLTSAGNHFTQALSGGLSFTGGLIKRVNKFLSASLPFTGAFSKQVARVLTAGNSFAGGFLKTISIPVSAGLSFTGNLAQSIIKHVNLTSVLSFTGGMTKSVVMPFTATLSFTGRISKAASRAMTSGLTVAGSVKKTISKVYTAGISFIGNLVVSTTHLVNLTGGVTFTGAFHKATTVVTSASSSFTGAFSRVVSYLMQLTGALSASGSFKKSISRALTSTITFAGNMAKSVGAIVSGVITFSGNISVVHLLLKVLTASLNFTGSYSRSIGRAISSGISFVGTQSKAVTHSLTAASTFTGGLNTVFNSIRSAATYVLALVAQFTASILKRPTVTSVYTTATVPMTQNVITKQTTLAQSFQTNITTITNSIIIATVTMERIL